MYDKNIRIVYLIKDGFPGPAHAHHFHIRPSAFIGMTDIEIAFALENMASEEMAQKISSVVYQRDEIVSKIRHDLDLQKRAKEAENAIRS
jgi:hypothetical protein